MKFMEELENPAMTFDEASMQRSKSFVFALQELKNLKPQLYSAADYCENSYLHSDEKQMVLDNLKDYVGRALVNAVDHLGTVAYKLVDLLEQQTFEVSTMDLNISTLNQKLLTCQTYTDKEGLRQQQLLAFITRHHKHYILPSSSNKKVQLRPHIQNDARKKPSQSRTQLKSSGTPVSKTLSWHLASETKSTLKKQTSRASKKESKIAPKISGVFQLLDNRENTRMKTLATEVNFPNGVPTSRAAAQTLEVTGRDASEGSKSKPLTKFGSFGGLNQRETVQIRTRSKSVLPSFFLKQRTAKSKAGSFS